MRGPAVNVPECPVSEDADDSAVRQGAERVREAWGLGEGPIRNVVEVLERHGVLVAHLKTSNGSGEPTIDAFSSDGGPRPLVVLTDKTESYVRTRFDASHELGHLVMHRGARHDHRVMEKQAHGFASWFLLPASAGAALPRHLNVAGWTQLLELKRRWGISLQAMLMRMRDAKILDADYYQSAMRYMSARGWRKQEPGDQEMGAPEAAVLLERWVMRVSGHTGRPIETLAREAGLPDDLVELVQASTDPRPALATL